MKLDLIFGRNGLSIKYITDSTQRRINGVRSPYAEFMTVNIESDDFLKKNSVFFGKNFKSDNTYFWKILKLTFLKPNLQKSLRLALALNPERR